MVSETVRLGRAVFRAFLVAWAMAAWAWSGGVSAQFHSATFTLEGLASRPYRVKEYHPLTMSSKQVAKGQVGLQGELDLRWPADDQLHLLDLECGGMVWSLPVCGEYSGGAQLMPARPGGAPFADRPGGVVWNGGTDEVWSPVLIAEAERLLASHSEVIAADLQRSLLWGGGVGKARERAGETLGNPVGPVDGGEVDEDSLQMVRMKAFAEDWEVLVERSPHGAVRDLIAQMARQGMADGSIDSLNALRRRWATLAMCPPEDVACMIRFRDGVERFADWDALSEEAALAAGTALGSGDLDGLVQATGEWWGGPDADRTVAWLLARIGDGGFGVDRSTRFRTVRPLPPGLSALLDASLDHPLFGEEAALLKADFGMAATLEEDLRAFDAGGDLVRLDEVAGSGPVLWLFVDAGAPSTVLPMQVLERTLVAAESRGGRGRTLPRDLQWVVVDVGADWEAFQQLVRAVAARQGGMMKWPYRLIHTGADVAWTEQFELQALPEARHNGPRLQPTPSLPPLPGPDLIDWLARRP